jgi:hypothetical protein
MIDIAGGVVAFGFNSKTYADRQRYFGNAIANCGAGLAAYFHAGWVAAGRLCKAATFRGNRAFHGNTIAIAVAVLQGQAQFYQKAVVASAAKRAHADYLRFQAQ